MTQFEKMKPEPRRPVWALEVKAADDRWVVRSTHPNEHAAYVARSKGTYEPGWSRIRQIG